MCNLPGFGGGGPSQQEEGINAQELSLNNLLNANYKQTFGQSEAALSRLGTELNLIQSGQTGPGFGASELAAKTSDIVNQAGAQARNVTQAVQDRSAGQIFPGGSESGLARASAIREQIGEEASSAAETQKSNALNRLTEENYAQGRNNAAQTVGGLEALSGAYSGLSGSSLAGAESTGATAFNQATQINKENLAKGSLLGGIIKTGLGAGLDFATGGISNLSGDSTFGENVGNFFSGGLNALSGNG